MTPPAGRSPGREPSRRTGIRDVARATGLSITTVSHALSGKGRVSDTTRATVREAAERLGYHPDPVAAGLASGRVGVIGLAVGHVGSQHWDRTYRPYYATMTAGGTMTAIERDHALVVVPTDPSSGLWARVPMDGLIVVDPARHDPLLAESKRIGLPVVTVGRPLDPGFEDTPSVTAASDAGLRLVLDHLRDVGARRIALFTGTEPDSYTLDSGETYELWCGEQGCPSLAVEFPVGADHAAMAERLLSGPDRPDAVHCLNETYGQALFTAARRLGLRIPDDLLVTSMCETADEKHWDIPLTVLSLETERVGSLAAAALIDLLSGITPDLARVTPRLVVRASTTR